jgi:sugar lactone lactonase YvrE
MQKEQVERIVGQGTHRYAVDAQWGRGEGGVPALGMAQGVTGDSRDRVYVFQRTPTACVLVFDREGRLLDSWGEGAFTKPHGIWMNPRDELYLTDTGSHTVTKWTTDGRLLRTWGTEGAAGDWGVPFNQPTKAVETADGELHVSDGYGNRHVHRFDRNGDLVASWGADGDGPGEFILPHDVWVDEQDRVLVCDRENRRVQHFSRDGDYLGEWADWQNPMQLFIRDGLMVVAHARAEISVRTPEGAVLASWPYESVVTHDAEKSPHSVWVDSRGDIYAGEVTGHGGLQKYRLQ